LKGKKNGSFISHIEYFQIAVHVLCQD